MYSLLSFTLKRSSEVGTSDMKTVLSLFRMVTVTGLIVGSDLIEQLKGIKGKLVLSDVMIKPETDLFLDNTTIDDVEKALGVEIIISKNDGYSFIETFKKK